PLVTGVQTCALPISERLGVARHVEAALTDDAVDQAVGVTLNGRFRQVGDPRKVLADRAPAATVGAMADGAVRVEERASLLQNFRRSGDRIAEPPVCLDAIHDALAADGQC